MDKFIKLTQMGGSTIHINPNYIASFYETKPSGCVVSMMFSSTTHTVTESSEEILKKIQKANSFTFTNK